MFKQTIKLKKLVLFKKTIYLYKYLNKNLENKLLNKL